VRSRFVARDEFRQSHETCQTVDDFNRDAAIHAALIERRLAELPESELREDAAGMDIPEPLTRLMRLRAAAAAMAAHFERRYTFVLGALFVILLLGAASFHVYAHLESHVAPGVHNPTWLAAFVGLLLLDVLLVGWVWARRLGERRDDYRALSEALRVRTYWGLAGIGKSVADSYLNQLRSEMSWTRRAMQCAAPPPAYWSQLFREKSPPDRVERLRLVGRRWVDRQANYFHEKFRDNHRAAARLRRFGFVLAFTGWLMGALLVFAWDAARPPPWLLIGSGILVLSGAILIAYCERRSHEELARQYERMWVVFTRGAAEFRDHLEAGDVESAQSVLETLGHEAIAEHAQWLILRRNRPFELLIH
jgi:hypothetical protein